MADAPSAATAPAEAGQPNAAPAAGEQAQAQQQATERLPGAAPEPETKKEIRPIPPKRAERPSLPGVLQPGAEDEGDAVERVLLPRRPDGTFMSRAEAEASAEAERREEMGEEPREPQKPALPPGEEEPKTKGLKFLGKDIKDISEAEQMHKSLQGMFKPLQAQVQTLTEERNYGYEAANKWEAAYKALEARIATAGQGAPGGRDVQAPAQGAPNPFDVKSVMQGIDVDAFEAVAVQGGLPRAAEFLAEQILGGVVEKIVPALRAEMQAKYESDLTPLREERAASATEQHAEQLINQVAALQTLDGKPAFPEMGDPEALFKIGQTWRESGLPPDAVMSPQGLLSAVALYRMMKGLPEGPAIPPVTPPAPVQSAGAAATIEAEPGGSPMPTAPGAPAGEMGRFIHSLRSSEPVVDPALGFARRRARQ